METMTSRRSAPTRRAARRGVSGFLRDVTVGIVWGVSVILLSIFLDYRDVLHFQSAHNFRHAAFQMLNNTDTIVAIEEASDLRFLTPREYESRRREVDGVAQFLAFRKQDLDERTAVADAKHKERESFAPEFDSVILRANELFELDKFCGHCVWVKGTTCADRVQFVMKKYKAGPNAARLNAMMLGTCTNK